MKRFCARAVGVFVPLLLAVFFTDGFAQDLATTGEVIDQASQAPVANARIKISGTQAELYSDAQGRFQLALPPGLYRLSVKAKGYKNASVSLRLNPDSPPEAPRIALVAKRAAETLDEVVVEGAYVQGSQSSAIMDKRYDQSVTEVLGSEQMAKTGDSDGAAALKRVTGLSLVDDKYIYVRGLGERYSSVLFNGAQVPSPDPTRRVVSLDLFPTEVLQGIVVQKSYSATMPGEFGGGTVVLKPKTFPESFFLKLALGAGYAEGTTFRDGLGYQGGDRDWTGKDDGARRLPDSIAGAIGDGRVITAQTPFNPQGASPAELQGYGRDLANVYDIETQTLQPNASGSFAIGNTHKMGDWRFGYLAGVRYAQHWDNREETRRVFAPTNQGLVLSQELRRNKTERDIDISAFANMGVALGNDHQVSLTAMMLRQTQDQAQVDQGFDDSPDEISRFFELEWEENQLKTYQLSGQHFFPALHELRLSWLYSLADAGRYAPNTRQYRYDRVGADESSPFRYSSRSNNNATQFADLHDDAEELQLGLETPFVLGETTTLTMSAGLDLLERNRDSEIRRFQFLSAGGIVNDPAVVFQPSLEDILGDANIRPDGFVLRETTRGTDNYIADQQLDAYYFSADWLWLDRARLVLGLRHEDNDQQVVTFAVGSANLQPVVSQQAQDDWLPSAALTWSLDADSQIRAIFAQTVSRPDFRELSPAPFTDPLLDTEAIGNPDLAATAIDNYDLRYERYFSDLENFSAALFAKRFTDPIEKILIPGTGSLIGFANADSADLYGIELDFSHGLAPLHDFALTSGLPLPWEKLFFGFNAAWIESEVALGASQSIQTNASRPLQGQSPYMVNGQLGWRSEDGSSELTALYNVFGKRIAQVGVQGAPDIYEQPFHQLDLTFAHALNPEWKLKLRARNLLDPESEFTQGDETARWFRKGREIDLMIEWQPRSH